MCYLTLGETLAEFEVAEFKGRSDKEVKQVFAPLGNTRFTQRLFSEDGREIQDDVFGANPMKLGILMDCQWIASRS